MIHICTDLLVPFLVCTFPPLPDFQRSGLLAFGGEGIVARVAAVPAKLISCDTFACGADLGAKMIAFCPTAADIPASAAPAFPVEAVTTTSAWISRARATTSAEARSLNEPVGLRDSSLSHRFSSFNFFANCGNWKTGVPPAL